MFGSLGFKEFLYAGTALMLATGGLSSNAGAADTASSSAKKHPSHIANWVASASKLGAADSSKSVKLSAFLGLRNEDELDTLIAAQSTAGSPDYGRHLTAAEFRARFAPSAKEADQVEAALSALGFTVGNRAASNLFVEFTGTVAQVK